MKKVLEISEEIEKILVDVLDTYMKTKGITALDLVNKVVQAIKQVESPPKQEG